MTNFHEISAEASTVFALLKKSDIVCVSEIISRFAGEKEEKLSNPSSLPQSKAIILVLNVLVKGEDHILILEFSEVMDFILFYSTEDYHDVYDYFFGNIGDYNAKDPFIFMNGNASYYFTLYSSGMELSINFNSIRMYSHKPINFG